MVHLATLIHDDIMDEAEIRRGRLTLAANWGNEIAVLFGDCLFAQALKLLKNGHHFDAGPGIEARRRFVEE